VNLVIACWGGARRLPDPFYDEHRECFIQSQIKYLAKVEHNLSQITFIDNASNDYNTVEYQIALENMPDKIGRTPVKFHQRSNHGFSYGAFDFAVKRYWDEFDYYIFLEDDQIIIEDNFDKFLIEEFERHPQCSYLCALYERGHAALSFGITSINILKKVINKHGQLPNYRDYNNYPAADRSQIIFSCGFEFGRYKLCDFSRKYKIGYIHPTSKGIEIQWVGRGEKIFMLPQQLMRGRGTELREVNDVRTQKWA
jgi:hypothetical protein